MAISGTFIIAHPEPERDTLRLLPVFLPFAGCSRRCVFCDQHAQTGVGQLDLNAELDRLRLRLEAERGPYGLGFFGGTFTGLDADWQERFLTLAQKFRNSNGLIHVRVSTRPDRVDAMTLRRLTDWGVDMVELGIQSFDDRVLARSERGYGRQKALDACTLVHGAGLRLGIQLLPGLPGHDILQWRDDVAVTRCLGPDVVRVYPCVVLPGTGLAALHARGVYIPWTLVDAVEEVGRSLLRFWEQGIRVIRLGVVGEVTSRIVAGPWHPAFGNMARSVALRELLRHHLAGQGGRVRSVMLPVRLSGELWGVGRANASALEALGIVREKIRLVHGSEIQIELE